MKYVLALIGALFLVSQASAATVYNLFDHSNGAQANAPEFFEYGLRLDSQGGASDANSFWSFESSDDGNAQLPASSSIATLSVDFAGDTASINGQLRNNGTGELWTIDYSLSNLTILDGTSLGDAGLFTSFGATTGSGLLINSDSSLTIDLDGLVDSRDQFAFTLAFESGLGSGISFRSGPLGETNTVAGWLDFDGTNDFLATVEPVAPVPLPAAGWMLLSALGSLGIVRRSRKS